ncbi:pyridoxamine 5'-phosphate oxidase [Aestuariirhabdus litorea]|uniref:Pyridoxine/pyridoxamine 5'-phosphate oxidase n=1 Tax=Aestuariirhabdus litorea TaxID=2528527 RepID=A0A3P3VJU6_9GAMM|nr:pyridoxamine 5'-phosphate oxidase [Aestuariirhabdus litorea]RRJ82982.1 pyridoxamine 5'-phosphate oxidase [Aestuariirhabdus litorea]RWW93142.1 pyridoxamine 5'-phosphate oxidase [Endozoicomonadaceae bacterium GTF-13]
MEIEKLRREYLHGGLHRKDLKADPIAQFELWLQQAIDAKLPDPTAMSVATVSADGYPSQRIVLLKQLDPRGFVFFTNLGSTKAQQIEGNPRVSLHFAWLELDRQVIISGHASRLSHREVLGYFLSRPKESQLAAWASRQSHPISSRTLLEQKFAEMKHKFSSGEIPLPSFWGGFRVDPRRIEFWQGGAHRLHDRFLYTRGESNEWAIERLAP